MVTCLQSASDRTREFT